jgi:hypothetical protein
MFYIGKAQSRGHSSVFRHEELRLLPLFLDPQTEEHPPDILSIETECGLHEYKRNPFPDPFYSMPFATAWYGDSIEFFFFKTYLQMTLYMVNRKTLHTHDLQYSFWSRTCHWHREAGMSGQTMI